MSRDPLQLRHLGDEKTKLALEKVGDPFPSGVAPASVAPYGDLPFCGGGPLIDCIAASTATAHDGNYLTS